VEDFNKAREARPYPESIEANPSNVSESNVYQFGGVVAQNEFELAFDSREPNYRLFHDSHISCMLENINSH